MRHYFRGSTKGKGPTVTYFGVGFNIEEVVTGTVPSWNTGLSMLSLPLPPDAGVATNAGVALWAVTSTGIEGAVETGGVDKGTMGGVSLGVFGLMVSFFTLVRGTKVSLVDTESFRPSNMEVLSFLCVDERETGRNLLDGRMFSLY